MSIPLALVLLFLGVLSVALCAIHRHRCVYCQEDARPTLSGRIRLASGETRRYTIRLEEITGGDFPNVPKAFVDERLRDLAYHNATLPEARN
jgi:hypothetical protein